LVNGHLIQDLGDLPPGGSKSHTVHMFPLKPGIQKISGFSIRGLDFTGATRVYDFNNLTDVFVDHHE